MIVETTTFRTRPDLSRRGKQLYSSNSTYSGALKGYFFLPMRLSELRMDKLEDNGTDTMSPRISAGASSHCL